MGDDGLDAAISPSEDELAFVGAAGGQVQLWLRRMDQTRATAVPGTAGARAPAWSTDGRALVFFAGGHLRSISPASGTVQDLAEVREPAGATWLDDGSVVFAPSSAGPLMRTRAGTTTVATTLQPGDKAHLWPSRAPGGFLYIALREDGRRVIRLTTGGTTRDLGVTDGHAQMAGSVLLHVRGGALLAQRLDVEGGVAIGRATALVTGVGVAGGRALVAASPRLVLLSAASARPRELVWIDERGMHERASDRGDYWQVRLSRDDRRAAVTMLEPQLRTLDVYIVPLASAGVTNSLSLALAADTDPVWSPDGRRVLFRSFQDGAPHLFTRAVGVAGAPVEPALRSGADAVPTDWRGGPNGGVLFHTAGTKGDTDIQVLDAPGERTRPAVASGFNESDGRWSPDGRWIAYVSDEFGQPDVFVQAWPSGARVRVTSAGGLKPRWGGDGRALYFLRGDDIVRVDLHPSDAPSVSAPAIAARAPGVRDYDVAHRGTRLLAVLPVADAQPPEIRALVDWAPSLPPVQ